MATLPWGFSPVNAFKEAVDTINPLNGDTNYNVFNELGSQTSASPQVQGVSTTNTPYNGTMYYDAATGQVMSYNNGQWTAGNGAPQSEITTSGGSTAPRVDPGILALYDNQIGSANQQLGRINNQRNIAYGNLDQSFTNENTALNNDRTAARGQYDLQKQRTGEDYTNTRAAVRSDAGNQFGSIQRLLGNAGAGRSSAAKVLAPFAVGKEAASRFGQVQDTFGRNQSDLDTNWNTTQSTFDNYAQDLIDQKEAKRREIDSGFANNEASLLDQIAQLNLKKASESGSSLQNALASIQPQQSRIQELLNSIDELGRSSVKAKGAVSYTRPDLAQYNYSRFNAPTLGAQYNPQADYVSPLTTLISEKDKKQNNGL